jgi:hypothetical protein
MIKGTIFMKKIFGIGIMITLFALGTVTAIANGLNIKLTLDNQIATVEGRNVSLDTAPFIKNDRTMVPLRFVSESMGSKVDWKADTREVIIDNGKIKLQIDNINATVEGKMVRLDTAPFIVNGRTVVPLRFVSESLGYTVEWNSVDRSIVIRDKNGEVVADWVEDAIARARLEKKRIEEEEREKREEERLAQIKPMVVSGFSFEGRAVGDNGTSFETADRIRIDLDGVNDPREVKVAYSYIQTGNNGEMTESQKQNFEKILRSRFGSDNAVSEIMKLIRTPGTHTATQQWSFYTSSGTHLRLSGAYRSVFVDVFR